MKDSLYKMQRLTQVLMVSGGLNIILLAALGYFFMKESPPRPYFELKPARKQEQQPPLAIDRSLTEVISHFRGMSFEQLKAKLANTVLVENGFKQRELALACLVTFHHFDLDRALLGEAQPPQKRILPFGTYRNGRPACMDVNPGLSERQFQAIIQFAAREKWPLTSKGLFLALKKSQEETSLIDAFSLTPEFLAIEMLFNRAEIPIQKSELLKVICEGDWALVSGFAEKQRIVQDLSAARRQRFLLNYIQHNSKAAAYLLLKTDGVFAAKKFDDDHILQILRLIDKKTSEAEQFGRSLLASPRSDLVRQMASTRLIEYAGKPLPEKRQGIHEMKIAPVARPVLAQTKKHPALPVLRTRFYVVQEGDSLWKIAKRFRVNVEILKAQNHLETDFLRPGITLKIP